MNASAATSAWRHIDEIRSQKFGIGKTENNPLTKDLHHAVLALSAELYTKDVHFLMELIQNAEDNVYDEGVEPTLEFLLTGEDVTGSGAPATLFVFNNEMGFSKKNIESLCSVGRSTKKGNTKIGYIGEKGIGFKSVFLVSPEPHIFSNGYQVKFREEPDQNCGTGYIVPEWVSKKPTVSDIRTAYGSDRVLRTTTIILPLKPEKVVAVETQLSALHPEILLFLSKIKRLYVRENKCDLEDEGNDCDSKKKGHDYGVFNAEDLSSVEEEEDEDSSSATEEEDEENDSEFEADDENDCDLKKNNHVSITSIVSIYSETNLVELSDEGADARVVTLSVKHKACDTEETCKYFMWRQAFLVKRAHRVNSRNHVDQWILTLAFPFDNTLSRGTSSVGIFAFLPTAMVTRFPFIIQADFILTASRESIVLDHPWNLGILNCVPEAFLNAFQACVRDESMFPSVGQAFEFLPVQPSSVPELNRLRKSIRSQLRFLRIVPYETFSGTKVYASPQQVIRILPDFRNLLFRIEREGTSLRGLSTLKKVLHTSLDKDKYNAVLHFLGVVSVKKSVNWYGQCIRSCNLSVEVSEELYIELLCFLAHNWEMLPACDVSDIRLLEINKTEESVLCSISHILNRKFTVMYALEPDLHSWLNKFNVEFGCPSQTFFLANHIQKALVDHAKGPILCTWLSHSAGVTVSSSDYIHKLCSDISIKETRESDLIIKLTRFLYHARRKKFINSSTAYDLCAMIPIIDGLGHVRKKRNATLVPASGSNWAKLFGSVNPFLERNFVDISKDYAQNDGKHTPDKVVLDFICKYAKATDIPELSPPNAEMQMASSQLSMEQVFLLLDWIKVLRTNNSSIPDRFIRSIHEGAWIKCYGRYSSPKQSILPDETGKAIYDKMKYILDDYIIDEEFYRNKIAGYQDELRFLGVGFGFEHVLELVKTCFVSLASSSTRSFSVCRLLLFIRFLRKKNIVDLQWLQAIKRGKWLKTRQGYSTPEGSVYLQSRIDADSFMSITNLPLVDEEYYGYNVLRFFSSELKLVGVVIDIDEVHKLIAKNISFPSALPSFTSNFGLLLLECIKCLGFPVATNLIEMVKGHSWLKTTSGFKCPSETILPDSRWGPLLDALKISLIDEDYYKGKIRQFVDVLSAIGVAVNTADTVEMIGAQFKSLLFSSELSPAKVLSMLGCIRELGPTYSLRCSDFECLLTEKWLKTRHGFKTPNESIVFGSKWGAISPFVDLPLIDDAHYGISIYKFKDELQMLGVISDFEGGAVFVAKGLNSPIDPDFVTADGTIALLECMKSATLNSLNQSILDGFLKNIAESKCLKTTKGYLVPKECVLFDSAWESILKLSDAPFIDAESYQHDIYVYKDQLRALGVKIDPLDVCSLLSRFVLSQTKTSSIKRIYRFLKQLNWRSENLDECNDMVWIPNNDTSDEGKWVNSKLCVLHDKDDLFGARLYSLDKYYKRELPLFSSAFGVKESPSLFEYFEVWNDWALSGNHVVTTNECYSFWAFILKHWNPETLEILKQNLTKISATSWVSDGIHLLNREQVFLPDDLRLVKLFASNASFPLFVWFPKHEGSSSVSSQRLFEICSFLGVKKISESVKCDVQGILPADQPKHPIPRKGLIERGLIKIILCFLASHLIMAANERQEAAQSLLDLSLYEIDQPIKISYSLTPSPTAPVEVATQKIVFWEKNSKQLLIDQSSYKDRKTYIKFAYSFAQEIAEGLLTKEREYAVPNLRKIIQMGFGYEFKEDAMDDLLIMENLVLFVEDKEFLDAAFPCSSLSLGTPGKRLAPSTPLALSKKQCK
ncbi:hypothetical protein UlMin_034939 [Ulmus minor]